MVSPAQNTGIEAKLAECRRRLVGTDARNRLLHVNRNLARGRFVNVIHERSDDIFRILWVEGKAMRFLPTGKDAPAGSPEQELPEIPLEAFDASRYTDLYLETPLGPQALEKKLLQLEAQARTIEEETGLSALFLAMGFLRWLERDTDTLRESPLVLLPVAFERDRRTSAIRLRRREEELAANLPLSERLRNDFGIRMPDIEETEEWQPSAYFGQVRACIGERRGWSLDEDGMQLGFFSFDKLRMLKDLEPDNWPARELLQKEKLLTLLGGWEMRPARGPEPADCLPTPERLVQIMDADASQTQVIEAVRAGGDLVVQGPPGTGKSQTIANIIASAVHDGKTVLFVAEKMAALSVVHDRLVRCGLSDVCLELHSHKTTRKAFWESVRKAYGRALSETGKMADRVPEAPQDAARLDAIVQLLHDPLPGRDYTPYAVLGVLCDHLERRTPQLDEASADLARIPEGRLQEMLGDVARYAALLQTAGPPWDHPFFGVQRLDLHAHELPRLKMQLETFARTLRTCVEEADALAEALRLPAAPDLSAMERMEQAASSLSAVPSEALSYLVPVFGQRKNPDFEKSLAAGVAWKTARQKAGSLFVETAFDGDDRGLLEPIERGVRSWLSRWFGGYRKACAVLRMRVAGEHWPREPAQRLQMLVTLLDLQEKRRAFVAAQAVLAPVLGEEWAGEATDFALLQETLQQVRGWQVPRETVEAFVRQGPQTLRTRVARFQLEAVRQGLARLREHLRLDFRMWGAADETGVPLLDCAARLEAMAGSVERHAEWVELRVLREKLQMAAGVCDALERGSLPPESAADALEMCVAEARWQECRRLRPEIEALFSEDRSERVRRFTELEHALLEAAPRRVMVRYRERVPRGSLGEMEFVRSEMEKSRRLSPIRTAMERAGNMLLRIKPVFMMSPLSVARFLPPGAVTFDLLVFDEASQVRSEEALGAVARARQLVVVGDDRQLPPTSFFQRQVDATDGGEEEEGTDFDIGEMESILSLCRARAIPEKTLRWHYRSRTPSLIWVSNEHFYDGQLILPPSPWRKTSEMGLFLRRVDGVHANGVNRPEARAIVNAVVAHVQGRSGLSLGVVAFSESQRDVIQMELEARRRSDPELNRFLMENAGGEPFFVKNLENVQGDERDVILISVGYGPVAPGGRLASLNFGPVNKAGGERRLNVLFSRARVRCEVFCSFEPADIDLGRVTSRGPAILRHFLEYASQAQENRVPVNDVPLDRLETDVGKYIQSLGYACDAHVGDPAFQISWAVRHPQNPDVFMLAVACDGECYRRSPWVRERDRLMREVLANMGWRVHRVWSTDWFNRGERTRRDLREALEASASVLPAPPRREEPVVPREDEGEADAPAAVEPLSNGGIDVPVYRRFTPLVPLAGEPHEASPGVLRDLVRAIVETEGPVHEDVVARRVTAAFGKSRTGSRIQEAARMALEEVRQEGGIVERERFWMTPVQAQSAPVRRRSREDDTVQETAPYLCPEEIRAADALAREHNGEMPPSMRVRCILNLLGFSRTGEALENTVRRALGLPVE